MSALRRLAALFVTLEERSPAPAPFLAPAPPEAAPVPVPRAAFSAAVLCAAGDAPALGTALGLTLADRRRGSCALVCVWRAHAVQRPGLGAPALPAARRLARALSGRGLPAHAAGRAVIAALPADRHEAVSAYRRLAAARGPVPAVLALGGPRHRELDALLGEQDLVVVATRPDADPALRSLALESLRAEVGRVCACEVPAAPPARALATAGLTVLPSVRRALAEPIEALG